MKKLFVILVIGMMAFIGCSSSATTTNEQTDERVRRNPYRIVRAEITASTVDNAYDLIYNLRNVWLRGNKMESFVNEQTFFPTVYLDTNKYGSLATLRNIRRDLISEIEFLRPIEANNKFGAGHAGGAIIVKMIK